MKVNEYNYKQQMYGDRSIYGSYGLNIFLIMVSAYSSEGTVSFCTLGGAGIFLVCFTPRVIVVGLERGGR